MRLFTVTSCLLLCSSSCTYLKRPSKLIADEAEIIEKEYLEELQRQQSQVSPLTVSLTWNQALTKLLERNPEVLRANFSIADSVDNMRAVWRNMIPSLSASLSDSATIENVSSLFADTNLRISSFITLSNLIDLPKTLYTNRIRIMATELSSEQIMRNQVIALYRLFGENQLFALEQSALNYEKDIIQSEHEDQNSFAYQTAIEAHKDKAKALADKKKAWVNKVNDLYLTNYTNIDLKVSTIPKVSYRASQLDLENVQRWGRLQLNLLAIESIADKGNIKELYARYLPNAFLSVSAPPLFQSGTNSQFRVEDIRLTPSFSWSLDTRDTIGRSIDRNNREANNREWTKKKRRTTEVAKLLEGKHALATLEKELSDLRVETKEYQELVKSGELYQIDLRKVLNDFVAMKEKEITIRAKIIDISTSFWLLDEERWYSTTKQWKQIRLRQEAERRKQRGNIPFFRKKPKT